MAAIACFGLVEAACRQARREAPAGSSCAQCRTRCQRRAAEGARRSLASIIDRSARLSDVKRSAAGGARGARGVEVQRDQLPWPPHLPVATLKLPQDSGARQSEISTFGFRQVVRPLVADDEAGGLPHHVELAVVLDLADQHRLGDVVVRHHGREAAGQVRHRDADDRVDHRVRIGGAGLLHRLHPHVEADVRGLPSGRW